MEATCKGITRRCYRIIQSPQCRCNTLLSLLDIVPSIIHMLLLNPLYKIIAEFSKCLPIYFFLMGSCYRSFHYYDIQFIMISCISNTHLHNFIILSRGELQTLITRSILTATRIIAESLIEFYEQFVQVCLKVRCVALDYAFSPLHPLRCCTRTISRFNE